MVDVAWVVEQQHVMERAAERNRTMRVMRGCRLCGRTDTATVYRFGAADQCVCADRAACQRRQEELWT